MVGNGRDVSGAQSHVSMKKVKPGRDSGGLDLVQHLPKIGKPIGIDVLHVPVSVKPPRANLFHDTCVVKKHQAEACFLGDVDVLIDVIGIEV